MILADTSVLVRQFRNYSPVRARLITAINPVVSGMTVAEFFAGAVSAAHAAQCATVLSAFGRVPTPEGTWEQAGRNQATLRANGLTVPLPDTVIATVAIAAGVDLWTYDGHFAAMALLLPGLMLYREP